MLFQPGEARHDFVGVGGEIIEGADGEEDGGVKRKQRYAANYVCKSKAASVDGVTFLHVFPVGIQHFDDATNYQLFCPSRYLF